MKKPNQTHNLDAWIAVNVMGWIPCRGDYWLGAVNPGKFNCKISEATSWAFEYQGGNTCDDSGKTYCGTETYQWNPSSDEECAMQVLTKCAEKLGRGHAVEISMAIGGGWAVQSSRNVSDVEVAGTLPLAISLFSKKLYTTL